MVGTTPAGMSGAQTAEPKPEHTQQTQPAAAKAGSQPVQQVNPGRKPFFRK